MTSFVIPCVKIRWVGIFDTVPSFGFGGNDIDIGYEFGIPSGAERVLHLVAADEHRIFFPLASITQGQGQGTANPNWEEITLPGAHSDVGGGYTYDTEHGPNARGYANAALQQMHADGVANGVPFGPLPAEYMDTNQTKPHDSRWSIDKSLGSRTIVRPKRIRVVIDDSYRADRKVFYHP